MGYIYLCSSSLVIPISNSMYFTVCSLPIILPTAGIQQLQCHLHVRRGTIKYTAHSKVPRVRDTRREGDKIIGQTDTDPNDADRASRSHSQAHTQSLLPHLKWKFNILDSRPGRNIHLAARTTRLSVALWKDLNCGSWRVEGRQRKIYRRF